MTDRNPAKNSEGKLILFKVNILNTYGKIIIIDCITECNGQKI